MLPTFVDYENAEAHFDSAEAASFFTFLSKVQPHAQIPYTAENELEALERGEIFFAQLMLLSPEQFAETGALFDGKFIYPGYPDAAGGSFYLNLPMAIPAAAQEKDGAWAFMKLLFSSDYYATRGGWLPLQSGFEASIKDALADGAVRRKPAKACANTGKHLQRGILRGSNYRYSGGRNKLPVRRRKDG